MPTSQRLVGGKQRPCGNTSSASYHHSISRCRVSYVPQVLPSSTQRPGCTSHEGRLQQSTKERPAHGSCCLANLSRV